jgi:hypothetical protein
MVDEKRFLSRLPERVPEGQALVHNQVWPRSQLNVNGFRAWLQPRADHLTVCRCGWAAELGEHYISRPH